MSVRFDSIPAELRERPQWVVWRLEERDSKPTKVPYRADGRGRASSTDAATWATFEAAVASVEHGAGDGIGFVFSADDPFVGVDLDDGFGEADRAAVMLALDSYSEESVSGQGVHVIVKASLNGTRRRSGPFEVYASDRYFVFTGKHVRGTPTTVEARQAELDEVLGHFLPKRTKVAVLPTQTVDVDDQELLVFAFAAKNGAEFRALWDGVWEGRYPSQSEADLALCSVLAFWTGRDHDRIDGMFRASGLYRPKWERGDYRERTIEAAISGTSETFQPSSRPRPSTSSRPRPQVTSSLVPSPCGGDEVEDFVPDLVPASHSWHPVDLVARRANPPAPPEIVGLFYRGYNHLVSGESEALKTWLELAAAAAELTAGHGVLWVDADDVGEGALLERLRLLGVPDEAISHLFVYVFPEEPLDDARRADVLEAVRARACRLAVLDGFNPLLTLHGLNPDSGTDVERFYRLIDPIRKVPTAVVLSDNVVKAREAQGKWAIGSERKKSKAEVHLGMKTLVPLVRGGTGRAKIEVHKDRPGHLPRPSPGILVIESTVDRCSWEIRPDESRDAEGEFRPTALMEKVSRFLELHLPEPRPRSQIEEAKLGKAEYVRVAVDRLIQEGYATEFEGPRSARLTRLERPFRADEDSQ